MGKATKVRIKPRDEGDGPTPEQMAQGGYRRGFVMHAETYTQAMAHVSAHDPVERWARDERLSDSQLNAIALVRRLWSLAGVSQKVTATYGERMPHGGSNEMRAINEIEAREDLHRVVHGGDKVCHWNAGVVLSVAV